MPITDELGYSTTALSNTTLGPSITLDGAVMTPSQVDDAFREEMSQRAKAITRHVAKGAGTYTAARADHNQFWRCTGAVTINPTAAATLSDGWRLWVRANGGSVTIDPSGVETIDGAATLVLADGQTALVICTGVAFFTVILTNTGAAAYTALTLNNVNVATLSQPGGRLTLASGVPVTTIDVTGATNVFYTPYLGSTIALYTGAVWKLYKFAELTLALGALTSGKPYDVFVYDNAGTLTLEATVWTNDTARATALALQDGIHCKSGALDRRYLGTFYTTSTTTTEDSAAKRFLWNMYNRVRRHMCIFEATNSWNYTTATLRQANANTANQLDFVRGRDEDSAEASIAASFSNTAANVIVSGGIGLDATNALAADSDAAYQAVAALGTVQQMRASYRGNPGIGRHFLAWLEYSTASGTTTWYGDNNVVTIARSGIQGSVLA